LVSWKPPTAPWLKVNTNGSVVGGYAACRGLFRDNLRTFCGAFFCNAALQSGFYAEVLGIIIAIEFAAQNGWRNIWLESNSTSALMIFSNSLLVPIMLRNRWHNARNLGIHVISSHIYREGNCCADKLAALGHSMVGEVWLDTLPDALKIDFFRDRCGINAGLLTIDSPNLYFRLFCCFLFFFFSFLLFLGGFLPSPPSFCKYFPLF